jgi:pyruvate ferredoxin oxidoreductase beta subunit
MMMIKIKTIKDIPEEELVVGGAPLCAGCPADMGLKFALKALGKNTVIINASGCMTLFVTYPHMPTKVPWMHIAIENAAAAASGLDAALKQLNRRKGVNILCYAGDGATYDIGFQALSGAVSRGTDFIYVCYNNNSFSNTGVQMSSATPFAAETSTTPVSNASMGNMLRRKPLAKIIAAHGAPYVATACISNPIDFMKKLQKAASIPGPKFIDLLAPCPTGWGFDASKTVEVGNLAIKTGAWPLYEVEKGEFRLTYKPAVLLPIERYLKSQARFGHLRDAQIKIIQNYVNMEWDHLTREDYWNAVEY